MRVFDDIDTSENRFLVYALDGPRYPASLFGCRESAGPSGSAGYIDGTAILLSGGFYRTTGSQGETKEVIQTGIFELFGKTPDGVAAAQALVGKIAASLTHPSDYALVWRDMAGLRGTAELLAAARSLGCHVVQTRKSILIGATHRQLVELPSMSGVVPGCDVFFVAMRAKSGRLVHRLLDSDARDRIDDIVQQFWRELDSDPLNAVAQLGDYRVFATLAGADMGNLAVNCTGEDADHISSLLAASASSVQAELYFAGALSALTENGHSFSEFSEWYNRRPLPEHWVKIR